MFTLRKDGSPAGLRWWMPSFVRALANNMLTMDEPDHTRLLGRGQFRRVTPATPEQTLDNLKADVQTVTDAVRKRGH